MDLSALPGVRAPAEVNALERPGTEPPLDQPRPEAPHHGLVKKAPYVDAVGELPEGVRCVRRATPEDAEAIAELQARCHITNQRENPSGGWLLQRTTAGAIREAMKLNKDFWIAESDDGKVIAYQIVTPPRLIHRPIAKHKFIGPYAERAKRTLASGRFIYMCQVAVDREFRGRKVAPAMQERVLKRYQNYPLVAHVGVSTQRDLEEWKEGPFEPSANNVASHVHHQRQGYRLVSYSSDLANTDFNSGLAPPDCGLPAVLAAMYINFRDGAEALPFEYVDPVQAILAAPIAPGEIERAARWFPKEWPESDGHVDPAWPEDRAGRYQRSMQRLELLFMRKPEVP